MLNKEVTFNHHSSDDVFLKTKTHSASIFTSFVLERIFSVKQCSRSTVLKFIAWYNLTVIPEMYTL